jgi:Tfp pilus assembly protein PilF
MRDLQTRGVLGVPPLAGLQPVSGVPEQQRRRSHLVPALAALTAVSAILLWQPLGDSGWLPSFARVTGVAPAEPQATLQTEPEVLQQPEPLVAATGDDLRDLFPIDSAINEIPLTNADLAVLPLTETVTESAAIEEGPVTEPVAAIGTPPVESQIVVESPAVDSRTVAETPAAAETSAPVDAPAKTTILRRAPGDTDVDDIVARALQSMRGHDLGTAERLLREALAIEPGNADTWGFLYGVLVSASRPAAAEQALQRGLSAADEPAALAKLYARKLLDRGDKDAAVSMLTAHRPAPASDTEYDAFLAALLQQTGQYTAAGEIYENLLAVDPGSGSWLIGLAMSNDSLGDRNQALLAFERALASGSLKSPLDRYARRRTAELKAYE